MRKKKGVRTRSLPIHGTKGICQFAFQSNIVVGKTNNIFGHNELAPNECVSLTVKLAQPRIYSLVYLVLGAAAIFLALDLQFFHFLDYESDSLIPFVAAISIGICFFVPSLKKPNHSAKHCLLQMSPESLCSRRKVILPGTTKNVGLSKSKIWGSLEVSVGSRLSRSKWLTTYGYRIGGL